MGWLSNYIQRLFYRHTPYIDASVDPSNYTAAGVLLTDGTCVLSALQKFQTTQKISGIGGQKEDGETYMDTALREMIEELFDIVTVPKPLLETLKAHFPPHIVFQQGTYILITYSFCDMERMLPYIASFGIKSRLYETMPINFYELVRLRFIADDCELLHLLLLPLYLTKGTSKFVHREFIKDLQLYIQLLETIQLSKRRCWSKSSPNTK